MSNYFIWRGGTNHKNAARSIVCGALAAAGVEAAALRAAAVRVKVARGVTVSWVSLLPLHRHSRQNYLFSVSTIMPYRTSLRLCLCLLLRLLPLTLIPSSRHATSS
ncbi:hypothetical protein E2C01_071677 [Portunus trituberculatus]|uniref:Uncharacterized protein n=1 Tax=Portunus trituberculatus TaxID=210409 RepID=A0A5B7I5Q5_PORTR|nr:hypothetical protein [Portunus trituberculatus]